MLCLCIAAASFILVLSNEFLFGVYNVLRIIFKFLHFHFYVWLCGHCWRCTIIAGIVSSVSWVKKNQNQISQWNGSDSNQYTYFARACVRICDFKFVDWANFLLQPSNGHTYGLSPVCILTCVLWASESQKKKNKPLTHVKESLDCLCIYHNLPQVEVQRESLTAPIECALEWLFARMHQLMSLQFWTFHKGFTALGAYMHPRAVGVQMLTHRWIITEHFMAILMWTSCMEA